MSNAGDVAGAALDASVYSNEPRVVESVRQSKLASGVDFLEREVEKAEDTILRLQEKAKKFDQHARDAEQSVKDAEENRDRLAEELEGLRQQLTELVDQEVGG